ncbi:MAG: hypothetical protein LCH52_01065 [Bacteroidetes bacterium]|nr:hypothetical protein [Bacteroidota bacterium]
MAKKPIPDTCKKTRQGDMWVDNRVIKSYPTCLRKFSDPDERLGITG